MGRQEKGFITLTLEQKECTQTKTRCSFAAQTRRHLP
jgi:hypothetical protein